MSGGDVSSDYKAATKAAGAQLGVTPTDLVLKIPSEEWGREVGQCLQI